MLKESLHYLRQDPVLNMGLLEPLRLGTAEILQARADGMLLRETKSGVYMLSAAGAEEGLRLLEQLDHCEVLVVCQQPLAEPARERFGLPTVLECYQTAYLSQEALPVSGKVTLGRPSLREFERIKASYHLLPEEELVMIYQQGDLFGGYAGGDLIGYVGQHLEGSMV